MRDPLTDPVPGDVIATAVGRARRVEFVSLFGEVVYSVSLRERCTEHSCKLSTWRRWARDGSVVERGPDSPPWDEMEVSLSPAVHGQVRLIANSIMTETNRWAATEREKITMTPEQQTLSALVEFGLACFLSRRGSERLIERVVELCGVKP